MSRSFLLGIAAVALTACGNSSGATVTIQMMAQMSSGQSGSAVLTDKGQQTDVEIVTTGSTDTGMQASHIHTGVCGSNGAIFLPLNNVSNGHSLTTVNATLSSLTGGRYYINVHNSGNINNIQACGNIP